MRKFLSIKPSLSNGRLGWLLGLGILIAIGIYLFLLDVPIMYAIDEEENILISERVDADTTFTSEYIHSVVRCPIIEKLEVNDQHEMVLMESWNCSFGAGIETEAPPGATDRMEDGFYVIDNMNQVFTEISFHPVEMSDQILTIDDKEWNLSKEPFVGETFSLTVEEESLFIYWWNKI
ncbi:hypothetical protein J2Z83_003098 [Virgibacillus natechei]|uniref:DUF1850 domain-containing protein n=1 Tax=Virgibacillus natechei TaxID=1216297 RepID=A0ABS4IKJ2_9BACI|nr:DUF1850 domain-containing protein [Virgibacillus natechei]MBP1970961.1 hypothetical protein [Virgibacillus natechei]UZD12729.1 DUF1850 domain-containing protein [Virgibacillus natechei]